MQIKVPQAPTLLRNQVKAEERTKVDEAFCAEVVVYLRMLIDTVILKKIEISNSNGEKKLNYDSPNWSHSIADDIGYRRALKEIHDLLKVEIIND